MSGSVRFVLSLHEERGSVRRAHCIRLCVCGNVRAEERKAIKEEEGAKEGEGSRLYTVCVGFS